MGFRAAFVAPENGATVARVAAGSVYRLFLNGQFAGYGPARGPHGYHRVDEWDLTARLQPGTNVVAIEVAGYNVNSYYLLDQPAFLQAEIVHEGKVLASTAGDGARFEAQLLPERTQKVQRYSFQRPFSEVYGLAREHGQWRTNLPWVGLSVRCSTQPPRALLPRRVPYPDFALRQPTSLVGTGTVGRGPPPTAPWKDRSLTDIGPKLGGYPADQLHTVPSLELQSYTNATLQVEQAAWPLSNLPKLSARQSQIYDLGVNLTGFIGLEVSTPGRAQLILTFDEVLSDNDVDFKRLGCVNAIALELESGPHTYVFESFEPYTLRYLKLIVLDGECQVKRVTLREYANPDVWEAHFAASDARLNRLFDAGRETFRQNAVDVFMDCPSRERAGWLCDSFFTARVARDLCGDAVVEQNFLENFRLPERFAHLPDGMLPMCYPADHNDGVFIPNWALWFVVQLEEYLGRTGDRAMVEGLRPRVLRLLDYFHKFRNEEGLLEKLESWVFVEWSKANDYVQDVNYPSNMLYAKALAAAGRMYYRPELEREAARIRDVMRRQAFDGEFFVDNAVRKDGKLLPTRNRTEVCQYFAFFFEVATPESHPKLWRVLRDDFGPQRKTTKAFPEVHPANAFVGNVLRLEILSRYGCCQQLLDESIAYLLYMVDRTGTLWENDGAYASCNHGFASHIIHVLYRDVLGLQTVDSVNRRVRLRFTDLKLDWCEGSLPTANGRVSLRWWRDGEAARYRIAVPAGYVIDVESSSRRESLRVP